MNTPLISIIIPTYNHAHLIKKCLQSIADQKFQGWEAIVVNNYSTDNTIKVVESFSDTRIKLINFHNNGVIAAARNEGIRNAKSDWIAFLDSDDWWYPSKLVEILSLLKDNDVIYHNLDVHSPSGRRMKTIKGRHFRSPIFDDLLTRGNQLPNSSAVIRKSLVEKVEFLSEDPDLFAFEDLDLWLKVSKVTERFCYLNRSLGAYWVSNENHSIASRKSIERTKYLYANHLSSVSRDSLKSAQALLNYLVTRERMLCGDRDLFFDFFKSLHHLKRLKFFFNSILFGILSLLK